MVKIYQIFLDGAAGWCTIDPNEFEIEISSDYFTEYTRQISSNELNTVMNQIRFMDVGDCVKFDKLNMKFYCFEMDQNEFNARKAWGDF